LQIKIRTQKSKITMAHHPAHEPTQYSPVAMAYAQSLLELANEKGHAEAVEQELEQLRQLLDQNPTFKEVLGSPAVGTIEREQLIERVLRNSVSTLVFNTLGVMNKHGRLGLIEQLSNAFSELLDQQLGKVEVDLTVSQPLTREQLETARKRISEALGRDAVVHPYVEPEIIGGMIIRVGDKLIDASVKYQLASIRERLLAAAPK
jgi:F-type H+-transporting ATPase subunit delta